ncbi:MAG TPA: hydroxyacid dehydrogenase [Candidatus Rubrimentiphilum sp.]|nr:hydroxyacid dehydrogenase [Candidatus Rubrimentiphilum sp.]
MSASRRPKTLLAFSPARNPDTIAPEQRARLESLVTLQLPDPVEHFDDARAVLAQTEVLITGWGAPRVDRATLERMPALRLIAHLAGSVKNILDAAVWQRGILVTSAAEANADPVAEYTLAAIILMNKRALKLRDAYRESHVWPRPLRDHAPGLGNYRKTIGIIGASRVGRKVIALLKQFAFDILLYDPYVDKAEAERLGARKVELDALLAKSDVVSIHAPETHETYRMIDARGLASMKSGAILINTARGSLVDTEALAAVLSQGRIDAVLDVTDPEPLPGDSPLYSLPNVLLTPHIAGAAGAETHRLTETILEEIDRYAHGLPLAHGIDAAALEHLA